MQQAGGASTGGDYSKYMKEYNGGASGSGSGSYEKYMKQYASDFSKYQKGGGDGSYSQYMEQYAGAYTGGASKENKKLTKEEAVDSTELVQQSGADSAGGFDYKKYTQGFTAQVKNMSDQDAVHDAYMKKYGQKYQDEYMPHIKNKSDPNEWNKAYKKKYVDKYAKQYMKEYDGGKDLPKNETEKKDSRPEEKKAQADKLATPAGSKKESTSKSAADAKKEPSKGSSWPLVETEAAATPDTLTSVVAAKPRRSPPALAAFAAALMMVALGVFVRRQLQKTAIELEDGPDMYSAYAPLV